MTDPQSESLWQRWVRILVEPPGTDLPPERRRRGWMVAGMALIGAPIIPVILVLLLYMRPAVSPFPALATMFGFVVTWVLTRIGHDRVATWTLCWSTFMGPTLGMVVNATTGFEFRLYTVYVCAFIASVLLSRWAALTLLVAAELMLLVAPHTI